MSISKGDTVIIGETILLPDGKEIQKGSKLIVVATREELGTDEDYIRLFFNFKGKDKSKDWIAISNNSFFRNQGSNCRMVLTEKYVKLFDMSNDELRHYLRMNRNDKDNRKCYFYISKLSLTISFFLRW